MSEHTWRIEPLEGGFRVHKPKGGVVDRITLEDAMKVMNRSIKATTSKWNINSWHRGPVNRSDDGMTATIEATPPGDRMVAHQIYLYPPDTERARKYAEEIGVSFSELVRSAIEEFVDGRNQTHVEDRNNSVK